MKHSNTFLLIFVLCLFSACTNYTTYHYFYIRNTSTDTLELRFKTEEMEQGIDSILPPYVPPQGSYYTKYVEPDKEDRLTNEFILEYFERLEFIKNADTFRLNALNIDVWISYYDEGTDWFESSNRHQYGISVTDEYLAQ